MVTESKLLSYLNLSLSNYSNTNKKQILVFNNMEYQITYYNPYLGSKQTVTGLVVGVWEDKIKIKYAEDKTVKVTRDCSTCTNLSCTKRTVEYNSSSTNSTSSNCTCNCIYNSSNIDTSKYDDPQVFFIPVANILDISYSKNNSITSSTNNTESDGEGEVHVMLLGISATTIKAIVVRLEFFDDNIEEAVKYVDLEVGGIYDLSYECIHKQTIYESRVKIVKIEECENNHEHYCCCGHHDIEDDNYYQDHKPGRGFVRENVGFNNSVYIYHDCRNTKDDYMQAPPVRKIKITVDTSEAFEGRYETIMLDSIKDCRLIANPDGSEPDYSQIPDESHCKNCEYKTDNCDPCDCIHCLPIPPVRPRPGHGCGGGTYEYIYDNKYKATVSGEKVQIYAKGETIDLDLDSLIKFYLGVD